MSVKHIKVQFKLFTVPIDYYRINESRFQEAGYTVTKVDIDLSGGKYFTVGSLTGLVDGQPDTSVFNIQVGKGKTATCYQLIKQYAEEGNYTVIVCSPFKKLVEKDYEELQKVTDVNIMRYSQIGDGNPFAEYLNYPIQIMTINCLLQNPGEKTEQSFLKQCYLSQLRQYCEDKGRKVIIFFDELHESVHNFNNYLLPNLMKWRKVVHKCFVSSATFSPAAEIVIKYIALLTQKNIRIYEAARVKTDNPSKIHLHLLIKPYTGKSIKHYIGNIKKELPAGTIINIITGTRAIADGLLDDELIKSFKPTLLTGKSDNAYVKGRSHIGTTFKTGVNIDDTGTTLIVVLPAIKDDDSNYGIFSDGIDSVVQSLARLRKTGIIHLVMLAPKTGFKKAINLPNPEKSVIHNWHKELLGLEKETRNFNTLSESYQILLDRYKGKAEQVQEEITELTGNISDYSYPSFETFVIDKGAEHLAKHLLSYGKELSPVVLYYCLHSQFCNATLESITLYTEHTKEIALTTGDLYKEIQALISPENIEGVKELNFNDSINCIVSGLTTSITDDKTYKNTFKLDGKVKQYKTLKNSPAFIKAIVENIYTIKTGKKITLTKVAYLRSCIHYAKPDSQAPYAAAYCKMSKVADDFNKFIQARIKNHNKGKLLKNDLYKELPVELYSEFEQVLPMLDKDRLIKSKTVSLLQDFKSVTGQEQKNKQVFNALFELYYQKGKRTTLKCEKYYVITDKDVSIWDTKCCPV